MTLAVKITSEWTDQVTVFHERNAWNIRKRVMAGSSWEGRISSDAERFLFLGLISKEHTPFDF